MIKIRYYLLLLIAVFLIAGCSQKNEEPSRIVDVSECGLRYTAPDSWKPYEATNIVPLSSATNKGDIFAHVQFNYATDESMDIMNSFDASLDTSELLIPFGEIFVVHEAKLDSDGVKTAFSKYDTQKEITSRNGYHYFLLSNFNGSKGRMTEGEAAVYQELKNTIPELESSISAFDFDEEIVSQKMDRLERTITFVSSTLEGKEISSAVFGDYDLTIVNFWGSYCYPDIDETTVLQQLYEKLSADYPKVNFIQVVIDTPGEEAQRVALEAKQKGGGKFTSVMTDEVLAGWITNNLQGLPTTIFVDKDAMTIGDQIEGVKTLEEYISALDDVLNNQNITGK